jgi:uncharacterized membrane protein YhaH (DUF805 family)
MVRVVDRFFSFSGRVKRGEFCFGTAFTLFVFWLTCLIRAFPRSSFHSILSNRFAAFAPLVLVILFAAESLFEVVGAISLLSFQVRRLHDAGRSGWLSIPIVAWQAYCFLFPIFLNDIPCKVSRLGLFAIPIVILLLIPSTQGKNHYGEEPGAFRFF